jgi:hypothetical protein
MAGSGGRRGLKRGKRRGRSKILYFIRQILLLYIYLNTFL